MNKDEQWVLEQREVALAYLQKHGVDHLGVGDWPAFHVSPYVAVWAVQSKASPGQIGWWVISGDCPTDYISGAGLTNPRLAMQAFARQWNSMSSHMKQGNNPPDIRIGTDQNRMELGELLEKRAAALSVMVADRDLWEGILDVQDLPNQGVQRDADSAGAPDA